MGERGGYGEGTRVACARGVGEGWEEVRWEGILGGD